ncbi:MAG: flagellar motor switch protein FliG [Fimbriimonadales bacterium]
MRTSHGQLTYRKKAAILLTALGPELAAPVLQQLSEEDAENLAVEIARLEKIEPEVRGEVIEEFHHLCQVQDFIQEGGIRHAEQNLYAAFGPEKASEMVERVKRALQVVPFDFLKNTDPAQLLSFIQDEHPQTIALVLAYVKPAHAAAILGKLSPEIRADVAERLVMMDRTPPDVVHRVESVLQRKLSSVISQDLTSAGGPKTLVEILSWVDRATERSILDGLTETNPELAEEVKNMMFVFEDIVSLEDRAVQQILKEVDMKELATALKGTSDDVQQKIFKNMSERATGQLKEDMEFMGPTRLRVIEEAQQRIVAIIRRLEEAGELEIYRGGEDEVVV